jgi:hypothetical protein
VRVERIRQYIDLIRRGGAVVEIRVVGIKPPRGKPYTAAGYFKDSEKAARACLEYERREPEGVFLTLNEVDPECWARSPEKITDYQQPTTSDGDITRRRWLPIDCDPKRVSGVCATEKKVAAAAAFAPTCKAILREKYAWPDPVEATSGNGHYLLYAVDLPNDEASRELLKAVLAAIDHQARKVPVPEGTPPVKVDDSMFNAARVVRVIGTLNAKGESTPDQPHRLSRLEAVSDPVVTVTREQLEAVARDAPQPERKGSTRPRPGDRDNGRPTSRLDVPKWLTARGINFQEKQGGTADGRSCWTIPCPFDSGHGTRGDTCVMQDPATGQLSAKCMHDSCQGKGWQEFKEAIGEPDPDHWDPPLAGRKDAPKAYPLGPLTLVTGTPKQTASGKIVLPLTLLRDGDPIDHFKLTDSTSNRDRALKWINEKDAGVPAAEVKALLGKVLADASVALEQARQLGPDPDAPTLHYILADRVPGMLQLTHRTERGLWSEATGGEVTRTEFYASLNSELVSLCSGAVDAPQHAPGFVDRLALLRAIKAELEVLWSDLRKTLPTATGAELTAGSEASERFKAVMVLLWTKPVAMDFIKSAGNVPGGVVAGVVSTRASLINRVKSEAKSYRHPGDLHNVRVAWWKVHPGYDAWWRPHLTDGAVRVLLAMKHTLAGQVGVELPGVINQKSLTKLGGDFGVLDKAPPVTVHLTGGGWLAVLSPDIVTELLEEPVVEENSEKSNGGSQ